MVLYNPSSVASTDFIANSVNTNTTGMVSIPANRYFSVEIALSASQSGVGTANPKVNFTNSTGGSPSTGTAHQIEVAGLLSLISSNASTISYEGYSGSSGASFDFAASGTVSCASISGFLL